MTVALAILLMLSGGGLLARIAAQDQRSLKMAAVLFTLAYAAALLWSDLRADRWLWAAFGLAAAGILASWMGPDQGKKRAIPRVLAVLPYGMALLLEKRTGLTWPSAIFSAVIVFVVEVVAALVLCLVLPLVFRGARARPR